MKKKKTRTQFAKITWELVRAMRSEYTGRRGEIPRLAKKYNISEIQTAKICGGTRWVDPKYITRYSMERAKRQDWKPIPGFPKYLVNSIGELWFLGDPDMGPRGRGLRPRLLQSTAIRDENDKINYVPRARLVLLAFKGPPKDPTYQARHLDDNRKNNDLNNLAWGSAKDNHDDGVRNGKHSKKGTKEALRYGAPLKGKPRPLEVVLKIRKTKQEFPERQYYGGKRNELGRFTGKPE